MFQFRLDLIDVLIKVIESFSNQDIMKKPIFNWNHEAIVSHRARLIPAPKSKPELSATTSLLAVLGAVDEFGQHFMKRVGGPAYTNFQRYYRAFCETEVATLKKACGLDQESLVKSSPPWGNHDRPDGVIVVTRGNKEWRALIEVKVGTDPLRSDQIAAYHTIAQLMGFDAVVTISNEAGPRNGEPPAAVIAEIRRAQLKKIPVMHIQWQELLGDGLALHTKKLEDNVSDEDQDWILDEWLRYIHDPRSEILIPARLGDGWSKVLQLAKKRLLLPGSEELLEVVSKWDRLAREIEFRMRMNGVMIEQKLSRKEKENPQIHRTALLNEAVERRTLSCTWKFPSPVNAFHCTVDLDGTEARYFFEVKATSGKSAAARILGWTSQMNSDLAHDIVVRPKWKKPAVETPLELSKWRGIRPVNAFLKSAGVDPTHGTPARIRFEWSKPIGGKSGRGGITHLENICSGIDRFYTEVMAGLRSVDSLPQTANPRSSDDDNP